MLGKRLRQYRILELLGEGGMGAVYRAFNENLEIDVAIKVIPPAADPEALRLFVGEAKKLARFHHPNIAVAHDFDRVDGVDFLVMEFVPGTTLSERLAGGPLDVGEAVRLCDELLSGLECAHTHGIIHCDIKPGNLRLTEDGHLKILDFGVAEWLKPALSGERTVPLSEVQTLDLPATPRVKGTPAYMPPEQRQGIVDARSDLWAAGAVLFEMVTGTRFTREECRPRELNPAIPIRLEAVILKALNPDPKDRYGSAAEFRQALHGALAEPTRPARLWMPASPVQWILMGIPVLALVAWGIVSLRHPSSDDGLPLPAEAVSMAMLPFSCQPGDPDCQDVAATIWDLAHNEIGKYPGVRSEGRASVMAVAADASDPATAARKLRVDWIGTGSFRRSGDTLQIAVTLQCPGSGKSPKKIALTRRLWELPEAGRELAAQAVAAIGGGPSAVESHRVARSVPLNPEAVLAFSRGLQLHYEARPDALEQAVREFHRAVQLEPEFADAWAALAELYRQMSYMNIGDPEVVYPRALAAADRAVALDPGNGYAIAVRATMRQWMAWEWSGVEEAVEKALRLAPGNPEVHYQAAGYFTLVGKFDQALREAKLYRELDILNPFAESTVGWVLFNAGRFEEAETVARQALQVFPGDYALRLVLGWSLAELGRGEEALEVARGIEAEGQTDAAISGLALASLGRRAEALAYLARIAADPVRGDPYYLAAVHAALGNHKEALDLLERALNERNVGLVSLKIDPFWSPIRDEPRFQEMVAKVGIP